MGNCLQEQLSAGGGGGRPQGNCLQRQLSAGAIVIHSLQYALYDTNWGRKAYSKSSNALIMD